MKKNTIILILSYAISVILICSYFAILFSSFSRDTSPYYEMFYMEKKLSYMPAPGRLDTVPGKKLLLDGKPDNDDTFYGLGTGWGWNGNNHGENEGFVFTDEEMSYLYFDHIPKGNRELTLHICDASADEIEFFVGDQTMGRCKIAVGEECSIEIPESSISDEMLCIGLRCICTEQSDNGMICLDYLRMD